MIRSKKFFLFSLVGMLILSLIIMIVKFVKDLDFDYLDPSEDVSST